MPLIRPVVLVYQEFATVTVTAPEPSLSCLVVGPAYYIQDYLDVNNTGLPTDKANIQLSTNYGVLEATPASAATPVGDGVIVVADAPNDIAGALLDASSVSIYFDQARAIIDSRVIHGNAAVTLNSEVVDFPAVVAVAASKDFTTVGTGNFDSIITSKTTGSAGDLISVSLASTGSSGATYNATTKILALTINTGVTTPAALKILVDAIGGITVNIANGTLSAVPLTSGDVFSATFLAGGIDGVAATAFTTAADLVLPGDRLIITDGSGNSLVRTVASVVTDTEIQLTADITTDGGFVATGSNYIWRIERKLLDQLVDPSFYDITGNTISINGGVTVAANGAPKVVSYALVYVAYRSLRQDLQELDTVASVDDITAKIGRIDARNPLSVGVFVALSNTTTTIQFYGVPSNDLVGHESCRDTISGRDDVYAICPLSTDTTGVLAMWNTDCVGLALPDETKGRPQRFRVVIGSGTLVLNTVLQDDSVTGTTTTLVGSAPAGTHTWTFPAQVMLTDGVLPGYTLVVTADSNGVSRNGTYTVAHVNSNTSVEVDEVIPAAATANLTLSIFDLNDNPVVTAASIIAAVSAPLDDLFLIVRDPNATFVQEGVKPGDIVEFPQDPNASTADYSANTWKYTVNTVLSDNRLQIQNLGNDTSTVANELPHTGERTGTPPISLVTQGSMHYRVSRNLSKDDQITALVQVAQSFASRRTILVWPDTVLVSGVTGKQPGYYLSCAVGGMTAGLPSHQGFTFLGIAAISQIYNANTYFTDLQLTDLMQGGWYVFNQANPAALPFTIHQLTTDPSTLESGEYSIVKNFDYVSLFFVDILQSFLGIYNVTTEAITFLRSALNTGIDTLKLQTLAKIGSPIISGSITALAVSPTQADRIVISLAIALPYPLNTIELHLVA